MGTAKDEWKRNAEGKFRKICRPHVFETTNNEKLSEYETEQDDRNYLFWQKRYFSNTNQKQADGRR